MVDSGSGTVLLTLPLLPPTFGGRPAYAVEKNRLQIGVKPNDLAILGRLHLHEVVLLMALLFCSVVSGCVSQAFQHLQIATDWFCEAANVALCKIFF